MKNERLVWFKAGLVLAIVVLSLIGCTTDEDLNPTDDRDKYLGSWSCTEQGATQSTFIVTITKSTSDSTKIFLANINSLGSSYKPAAVVNGNSLTIPVYNSGGYTVSGSGNYNSGSGTISLTYTINGGGNDENYTAVLSK